MIQRDERSLLAHARTLPTEEKFENTKLFFLVVVASEKMPVKHPQLIISQSDSRPGPG